MTAFDTLSALPPFDVEITESLPAEHALELVRGDAFHVVLTVRQYGGRVALSALSGAATIRRAIDHSTTWPLTVNVAQDTTGEITISATASETAELPESGVWDLQLQGASAEERRTLVRGSFTLLREVT